PWATERGNLQGSDQEQRVPSASVNGSVAYSLNDSKGEEPPNSAAAPDRVPFAGPALPRLVSVRRCASRCRNRKARGRVSGKTLGRRRSWQHQFGDKILLSFRQRGC